MMPDDAIITATGRVVRPAHLDPSDVCIADIAHSLSMQCRWTGHVREFYSVGQHSFLVSQLLELQGFREHALWGLLHDAPEVYLVDVAKPMKGTPEFEAFRRLERRIMDAICEKFGLPLGEPPQVKRLDSALLSTEYRQLMPQVLDWHDVVPPVDGLVIDPWPPLGAKAPFLERFHSLTDGKWRGREEE